MIRTHSEVCLLASFEAFGSRHGTNLWDSWIPDCGRSRSGSSTMYTHGASLRSSSSGRTNTNISITEVSGEAMGCPKSDLGRARRQSKSLSRSLRPRDRRLRAYVLLPLTSVRASATCIARPNPPWFSTLHPQFVPNLDRDWMILCETHHSP